MTVKFGPFLISKLWYTSTASRGTLGHPSFLSFITNRSRSRGSAIATQCFKQIAEKAHIFVSMHTCDHGLIYTWRLAEPLAVCTWFWTAWLIMRKRLINARMRSTSPIKTHGLHALQTFNDPFTFDLRNITWIGLYGSISNYPGYSQKWASWSKCFTRVGTY